MSSAPARSHHQLRIIGGQWRHRRLAFYPAPGLRPTPDRVRETLFNWLQPMMVGARCLDLFAGSGILGLEAESRGASSVVWLENQPPVVADLQQQLQRLKSTGQVIQADALHWLQHAPPQVFDLVFLDPPFQTNALETSCHWLVQRGWLASGAWIYVEQAITQVFTHPASWQLWRQGKTQQTRYSLFKVSAS